MRSQMTAGPISRAAASNSSGVERAKCSAKVSELVFATDCSGPVAGRVWQDARSWYRCSAFTIGMSFACFESRRRRSRKGAGLGLLLVSFPHSTGAADAGQKIPGPPRTEFFNLGGLLAASFRFTTQRRPTTGTRRYPGVDFIFSPRASIGADHAAGRKTLPRDAGAQSGPIVDDAARLEVGEAQEGSHIGAPSLVKNCEHLH